MKIAICDDNKLYVKKVERMIANCEKKEGQNLEIEKNKYRRSI